MPTLRTLILATLALCLFVLRRADATDFFFEPDTASGGIGQTVLLSGRIDESVPMRGYAVYMAYDTNRIRLAEPPVPGSLIAGRQGLDFHYFDHRPFLPNALEITATVFSSDFWSGPGELFQARFLLLQCGDDSIVAPYAPFFLDSAGNVPAIGYHPAVMLICDRVPEEPTHLVIRAAPRDSVTLRWNPVAFDTLGRRLLSPVVYAIYREQVVPVVEPPSLIATVPDTVYAEPIQTGGEYLYRVTARTNP
jgi:hypothetical protein